MSMTKKAGFNEPDDIRDYDHHPMSPYYVAPPAECTECGNLFDSDDGFEHKDNLFCSHECVDEYREDREDKCEICGTFLESDETFDENGEHPLCSEECAKKFYNLGSSQA